jgi:hypothetical protein
MKTKIYNDFYDRKLAVLAAFGILFSFFFFSLSAPGGLFLCLIFSSFLIFLYRDEVASTLGIFLLVNNTILTISFFLQNGIVSYLWNPQFDEYYYKTILLENLFWFLFIITCGKSSSNAGEKSKIYLKNKIYNFNSIDLLFFSIPILIIDIIFSYSNYFISYIEFSATGTVGFELGAAFLAFGIFLRIGRKTSKLHLILETIAVLLVLYIAIGSGKRLPLAYPIFAYTVWMSYRYGRLLAASVYLAIATGGYAFGIFRDTMVLQSISSEMLVSGLGSTNQGATLHASAVYIRIVDENLVSAADQLISFISNFFLAIFVSVSALPDAARINEYASDYYGVQGNGGLIGAYSYFFLGWGGPAALSVLLAWIYKSRGAVTAIAFGFLAVLSPRWTLYNIGPAMRILGFVSAFIALSVWFDFRRLRLKSEYGEAAP